MDDAFLTQCANRGHCGGHDVPPLDDFVCVEGDRNAGVPVRQLDVRHLFADAPQLVVRDLVLVVGRLNELGQMRL